MVYISDGLFFSYKNAAVESAFDVWRGTHVPGGGRLILVCARTLNKTPKVAPVVSEASQGDLTWPQSAVWQQSWHGESRGGRLGPFRKSQGAAQSVWLKLACAFFQPAHPFFFF